MAVKSEMDIKKVAKELAEFSTEMENRSYLFPFRIFFFVKKKKAMPKVADGDSWFQSRKRLKKNNLLYDDKIATRKYFIMVEKTTVFIYKIQFVAVYFRLNKEYLLFKRFKPLHFSHVLFFLTFKTIFNCFSFRPSI